MPANGSVGEALCQQAKRLSVRYLKVVETVETCKACSNTGRRLHNSRPHIGCRSKALVAAAVYRYAV